MQATLEEATVEALPEDDITHFYCCDKNVARCGLDITDEVDISGSLRARRYCKGCVENLGTPCGDPTCLNLR